MSAFGFKLPNPQAPDSLRSNRGKVYRKPYDLMVPALELYEERLCNLTVEEEGTLEKFQTEFQNLQNDNQRFDCIYRRMMKYSLFRWAYQEDKKDPDKMKIYRTTAIEFYQHKFYSNSLESATEWLKNATTDADLGQAYAHRARCLARLDLHIQCLQEIERAFKHGVDRKLADKLRKERSNFEHDKRPPERHHTTTPFIPFKKQNRQFRCARDCLKALRNPDGTWRYIAERYVEIGEVVAVDEPILTVITDRKHFHCHHCLTLCYNPIPCRQCSDALYCGEKCLEEAFLEYHQFECAILNSILILLGKHRCLLASLKAVIIYKEHYIKKNPYADKIEGAGAMPAFDCHSYEEMCELMRCSDDLIGYNLVKLIIAACFIYYLLKNHTDFFYGDDADIEGKFKHFIMPNLRMSYKYALSVDETIEHSNGCPVTEIYGHAIYNFGSHFRHSCASNLVSIQYGLKKVYRAIRRIKCGEEFTVRVAPPYYETSKEDRTEILKSCGFVCKCKACQEDWPLMTMRGWYAVKYNYVPLLEIFTDLTEAKVHEMLNTRIMRALKIFHDKIGEPFDELSETFEIFYLCHRLLGNCRRIP